MTEKRISTRIQHKHDTKANWDKASLYGFVPKAGEIIIYDSDANNPDVRIKIGDGVLVVSELPFIMASELQSIDDSLTYLNNTTVDLGNALTTFKSEVKTNTDNLSAGLEELTENIAADLDEIDEKIEAISGNKSAQEAFLTWGGQHLQSNYSPIDAALIPHLNANRFALGDLSGITFEYSRNTGSTWTKYAADAGNIAEFFVSRFEDGFVVGKGNSTNNPNSSNKTTKYMLRIGIEADKFGLYAALNKFVIYVSTGGFQNSWCTIRGQKDSEWEEIVSQINLGDGYNVINLEEFIFGAADGSYSTIQFIFGGTSTLGASGYGLTIKSIYAFGGECWTTASSLAKDGNIFNYEINTNDYNSAMVDIKANFSGTLEADLFSGDLAGNASSADYAMEADNAEYATRDAEGNVINETYVKSLDMESALQTMIHCGTDDPTTTTPGLFYFKYSK